MNNPSATNQQRLKAARETLQLQLREIENDWWLQKAKKMQKEADENNSAGFFNSLKEMYGPQAKISNAILSDDGTEVITEPSQLIGR